MKIVSEVKPIDRKFYEDRLADFLPERIIDIHSHVWLEKLKSGKSVDSTRRVTWPTLVAKDNSIEDLLETYRLFLPGKKVIPLIFSNVTPGDDPELLNGYTTRSAAKFKVPSLLWSLPEWNETQFEKKVIAGGFLGTKPYLDFAPSCIPTNKIRIFDFIPHHQLKVLDKHSWVLMLHIPRPGRLKDQVNLAQLLEIERKYPEIKLVIAHVGRAYCPEDAGSKAFEVLAGTRKMMFDISANTNAWVFEQLIKAVGPKRILFGSDLPITRMRMRRVCEKGVYINLVPKGLYGDVSGDKHMREIAGQETERLTFFLYEEIDAFRRAAETTGLTEDDIQDVFYRNAFKIGQGAIEKNK